MTAACIKAHEVDISNPTVYNSSIKQGSNKIVIATHTDTYIFTSPLVYFPVTI